MNLQEFIYANDFVLDPEELSENLAYEIVQQMMELPELEEIDFLELKKGKNTLKSELKRKDANHRGRDWRPKFRTENSRWCGKPVCPPDTEEDDGTVFDFEVNENISGNSESPLMCEGMNLIISEDGSVGAVCFNTNYKGERIIHE